MTKLLMVCMGNICRSPMAQVVTLHMTSQAGLSRIIQIDAAGTHAGRVGSRSDPRAQAALKARGYVVGKSRSRQVTERDFDHYDLILAMDRDNLSHLLRLCPGPRIHKLKLFLEFAQPMTDTEVPDPYYGSVQGFERVLDLCEAGARGLLTHLQAELSKP